MPGYKQTEVGVIPEDWEICPVEKKGQVMAGKALAVHAPGEQRPYLRTKNVFDGRIDIDDVLTMPMTEEQFPQFQLRHGDVLLNEGQSLELVGRCSIYKVEYPAPCAIQNALLRFRPRAGTSASFASHLFRNCQKTGIFAKIALQTTSVAHLGSSRFASLRLAWPTTNEQIAIAAALDDIDHLIKSLDDLIVKKRGIKQAVMQELLTGKRRLTGFEGEWVAGKLGGYVEKIVGGGTPSRANPGFWGGEIPWATVKDLTSFQPNQTQEWLTRDGLKNSSANLIPAGTLIASTRMALGKAVIFGTDVAINQDLKAIFFGKNGMARFFCYWFEANASAIDAIGGGSTVKGISLSQLKALNVASPGLAEQNAIVDVISDIETEIETLENRLTKTRAIKQAMMQELLTGRIRLR